MVKISYHNEISMYPDIIESIIIQMNLLGYKYKIYKTWKEFDSEFKEKYSNEIAILNKEILPDITVIYKDSQNKEKSLIIEVKKNAIMIKDLAQAKMYGDVFKADSVLLVSLEPIRKSFIEFNEINPFFMKCSNGAQLYTCTLENKNLQIQKSYPLDGGVFK